MVKLTSAPRIVVYHYVIVVQWCCCSTGYASYGQVTSFWSFFCITGNDDHLLPRKRIGRYCAVPTSTSGWCLCIYAEYACVVEQPTSIHSRVQLEHYKNKICDKHHLLWRKQSISTPCGCIFPLQFKNSLCYLEQRYPTNYETANLPQVIMTSDEEWDPFVYTNSAHEIVILKL